jgi:hypothetical protein
VAGTGFEPATNSPGETGNCLHGGAKSGALKNGMANLADPGLTRLVAAWVTLPAKVKAKIIAIVEGTVAADGSN